MEDEALCFPIDWTLCWDFSFNGNAIFSNQEFSITVAAIYSETENCVSIYSKKSAALGRCLGCILSGR